MVATTEHEARAAVDALIEAFGHHDRERYFAAFTPDATFTFYNVTDVLRSRADYETLWRSWEEDGFRVLSCSSEDSSLRMLGNDVALFTHRITTRLANVDGDQHERETIVLQRQSTNRWLAVHEHLSRQP